MSTMYSQLYTSDTSNLKYFGIFDISIFETTAIIKIWKFTVFSSGSFCQIYRVTDEALIAETMVWPNFFLMNVFFALKGSKLFIIISYHCSWMLCHVAAVKSPPALIYSAGRTGLVVRALDSGSGDAGSILGRVGVLFP